jgi:hypothetical protein
VAGTAEKRGRDKTGHTGMLTHNFYMRRIRQWIAKRMADRADNARELVSKYWQVDNGVLTGCLELL